MGMLVDGQWVDQWYDTKSSGGKFVRKEAGFRNWITDDGSAGPSGSDGFKAESGRYHLYVSMACPWAHRTLIFRKLKQLESHIEVSVVGTDMLENGWQFDGPGSTGDALHGAQFMHQIYTRADSRFSGRVTVPVLWDKKNSTIVSNESSEIIRMFNSAFDSITGNTQNFYPEHLREEINSLNDEVYERVNNGVYRCGFATTQSAYEESFSELFATLDRLDTLLSQRRFLAGDSISEADWRLFPTLVRFDSVYFGHFKCNRQRIVDYDNLSGYLRELYQVQGIADTVKVDQIKRHYYYSHESVNPTRVIPVGPDLDLSEAHGRG